MTEICNNQPDGTPRLILNLIGPFVVHFHKGSAIIHAPLCIDHHANILTDSDDISLHGLLAPAPTDGYPKGFTYNLTGPESNKDKVSFRHSSFCPTSDALLILDAPIDPIEAQACHLVLYAPMPNVIVPLLAEQIWIHKNGPGVFVNTVAGQDPSMVNEPRARGLRFIYCACPTPPAIELLEHPDIACDEIQLDLKHLTSNALGFEPPQFHITLRFTSNSASSDTGHEDAYNCFQEIRKLIPESLRWRVDFDNSLDNLKRRVMNGRFDFVHHGGSNPVDCGAAVVVASDTV